MTTFVRLGPESGASTAEAVREVGVALRRLGLLGESNGEDATRGGGVVHGVFGAGPPDLLACAVAPSRDLSAWLQAEWGVASGRPQHELVLTFPCEEAVRESDEGVRSDAWNQWSRQNAYAVGRALGESSGVPWVGVDVMWAVPAFAMDVAVGFVAACGARIEFARVPQLRRYLNEWNSDTVCDWLRELGDAAGEGG